MLDGRAPFPGPMQRLDGGRHFLSMTWQSYCQERAARCQAYADAASDPHVTAMFKEMAAEWRSVAEIGAGHHLPEPRITSWPPTSRDTSGN